MNLSKEAQGLLEALQKTPDIILSLDYIVQTLGKDTQELFEELVAEGYIEPAVGYRYASPAENRTIEEQIHDLDTKIVAFRSLITDTELLLDSFKRQRALLVRKLSPDQKITYLFGGYHE